VKQSHRDAAGLALALAAALLAHHFVLDLELMGWDSWPTVAASRISSLADFAGSFSEELMDGRYPHGRFYRPLTNLSFALDHARSGLEPRGYQETQLAILLAAVVAVFGLARRWLGTALAAGVAAAVFALHPLQLETVPVAARRADMLFTLFLTGALWVQPLGPRAGRAALAATSLLVLLSAASKDTGAVALPVVAAAQWWLPAAGDARERTRRTLARCAAPAAAFLVFLAARTAALGGLGGHPGSDPLRGLLQGPLLAPEFARSLLLPQPWSASPALSALLCLGLALGLAVALLLAARAPAQRESAAGVAAGAAAAPGSAGLPAPGRVALFLLGWQAALLAMTGVSGERTPWYAVPLLAPYALLLGLAAQGVRQGLRSGRRAAGLLAGAALMALLGGHLRYSPLCYTYGEWSQVSDQARAFLGRLDAALAAAQPGATLTVPGLPLGTGAPLERVGVRSALCLADYSVAAWAELAHPGLPVRVVLHTQGPPTPPRPGTVTIDAVPLPSPVLSGGAAPR
jgi:hypothetical protein